MAEPLWSEDHPYLTIELDVDEGEHALTSSYVERFWLPVLGPTSIVLLRHLGRIRETQDPLAHVSVIVRVEVLAFELGLGVGGVGKNSPLQRTCKRLVDFGVARFDAGTLYVRRSLPDVPERLQGKWPPGLLKALDRVSA